MDKMKGIAKSGWQSGNDKVKNRPVHRDSWKSDLKGMATNRNKDPYEEQKSHTSAPLSTLKDPASFAPPPKHQAYYGPNASKPGSPAASSSTGGLGGRAPAPLPRNQQVEEEQPKPPPEPYRRDTTGINTANMPKPPVRRADGASPAPPPRNVASPRLPARQQPPPPTAQRTPPPSLPPRMNEYPDEYTAPPPPTYGEATQQPPAPNPTASINGVAASRLAQAGVNVPGFGIGNPNAARAAPPQSPPASQGHSSQLSELQSRFSRMGGGALGQGSAPPTPGSSAGAASAAAAQKKPAPPPPPKKAGLGGGFGAGSPGGEAPPPLPLASKPRPG